MEVFTDQLRSLTDEMGAIRLEIVNMKAAHASLHQASVEANAGSTTTLTDHGIRLGAMEGKMGELTKRAETVIGGAKSKALIEAKNITVEKFAGSLTDGRAKYLEWCEKVKDRCELYDHSLAKSAHRSRRKELAHIRRRLPEARNRSANKC